MPVRRWLPIVIVIASGLLFAGILAVGGPRPPLDPAGLPPAMREPPCEAGQGIGSGHILWVRGSSFATPREALAAALTARGGGLVSDFTGRYVRVGEGTHATLGREFMRVGIDGEVEMLAFAVWQREGGWLVSGHQQCYWPAPGDGDAG